MNLSPLPIQKFWDNAGIPLVKGQLFVYAAGTNNKISSYTDYTGAGNTNPVILDFRGECRLWLDPSLSYKLVLSPPTDTDPPTNPIWSVDHVTLVPPITDNAAVDTGTQNNVTLIIPSVTALLPFLRVVFRVIATNDGPVLLTINGLPAKPLVLQNSSALAGGELQQGSIYEAIYDGVQWQIQGLLQISPRIPAESAAGVIPTFYTYKTTPKLDVRRYLTSAWDSGGPNTTGLQTAVNMAYAAKGRLIVPNGLDITSAGFTLTMPGNRSTQGFAIEGPGWNGARITQVGTPTALITIAGSTPNFNPSEAPIVMEGFSLVGLNNVAHGILLDGVAYWRLSGVQSRNFAAGIYLKSALLGVINDNCMSNENQYGLLAARDGASPYPAGGSGCNRVTVSDSIFNLNSVFGLFVQSGDNWALENLGIEGNGTTGNVNTGGIRLTGLLDDDIGVAQVACRSLRMETNKGTPFLVDACPGLILSIKDTLMLDNGEATSEILIAGADRVSIEDTMAPAGGGSIWNISCNHLVLKNTKCGTLTDSGVTYPYYRGAGTATGTFVTGRTDSFTVTLTGVTTTVTGTAFSHQDGDCVKITLPVLTGTSNSTAATVTGIPAYLRPLAARVGESLIQIRDNSLDSLAVTSISTGGVVTLSRNDSVAFTGSGAKGVLGGTVAYRM